MSSNAEPVPENKNTDGTSPAEDALQPEKSAPSPEIWLRYAVRGFIGLLVLFSIIFAVILKHHETVREDVYRETGESLQTAIFERLQTQEGLHLRLISMFETIAQLRTAQVLPKYHQQTILEVYDLAIEELKQLSIADKNPRQQEAKRQFYLAILQAQRSLHQENQPEEAKWCREILQSIKKRDLVENKTSALEILELELICSLRLAALEEQAEKSVKLLLEYQKQLTIVSQQEQFKKMPISQLWFTAALGKVAAHISYYQENKRPHRTAIRELIKHQTNLYNELWKKLKQPISVTEELSLQTLIALDELVDAKLYLAKLNHSKQSQKKIITYYNDEIGRLTQHCSKYRDQLQNPTFQHQPILLILKCRLAIYHLRPGFPFEENNLKIKKQKPSKP